MKKKKVVQRKMLHLKVLKILLLKEIKLVHHELINLLQEELEIDRFKKGTITVPFKYLVPMLK